ncbi:MAG: tryptophan-rich sensory protein [Herpetosiphonaceae bacterium]|nr:tryptophan-rich sensory protein [Herpetosiphonaceae bacterium]
MTNQQDSTLTRITQAIINPPRYRWWHAVAFEAVAQLIEAPGFRNTSGPKTYKSFKQASFAPPSWVFGPAWAINNLSVLWGNLRLLNMPADTPYRRPLLWLQGGSWLLFSTFSYAYFGLQSPILAFTWTSSMYALTIASAILASNIDPKIVTSLITLLLWLSLASVVAAYQMVYNPDPFFGTPAWR